MRIRQRIFGRRQGGATRFYLRVGDYADVGGRQREALRLSGTKWAVTDPSLAETLAGQRLAELQRLRLRRVNGMPLEMTLAKAAREHLRLKELGKKVTSLDSDQRHLERACEFFNGDTLLDAITPQRVGQWIAWLQATVFRARQRPGVKNGRKPRIMSASNARKHLNSLSNLCRRAQEQGWAPSGWNPAASLMVKPTGRPKESRWFETHEIALLLESARTLERKRPDLSLCFAYELIATAALTGARPSELLGLTADDVSFDRSVILIRGTKTASAFRSVPLWPQLREILYPYICPDDRTPRTGLLFGSPRTGERLRDARKMLDAVSTRVGLPARSVNLYAFRHSYCAARLQTLDRGAPISPYTVGKELGHGGDALVRRVYGHLGETRHRADVVEYRIEQHAAKLKDRLAALRTVEDANSSVSSAV